MTHVGYEVHDVIVPILTRSEELVLVPVGIIGLEHQFSVFLRVTVLHRFYNMKFELKMLKSHRSVDLRFPITLTCLPNGQMLNRWLSEKNNLSVVRLRFRGAKKVNKCCMFCIL